MIEGYAQTSTKLNRDPKVAPPPLDMFNFDEAAKACQYLLFLVVWGRSLLLFLSLHFGQGLG